MASRPSTLLTFVLLLGCGGQLADSADAGDAASDDALSDATPGRDGAPDASGADSTSGGADATDDTSDAMDGDVEAGPACPPRTACTTAAGDKSICAEDGITCDCTVAATNCLTVYSTSGSAGYVCIAGVCVPGNCRTDLDCFERMCGVPEAHFCGKCSKDADCVDRAGTPVCELATGLCVAGACMTSTTKKSAICELNPADVCCGPLPGGTGTCAPGDCCVDTDCGAAAYCQRPGGAKAGAGSCAKCPAIVGGVYYVNPVDGDDSVGSGGATSGRCAFRTLTAAIKAIRLAGVSKSSVHVVGGASATIDLDAAETFPITVGANMSVVADGKVRAVVPASTTGFELPVGASLSGFLIEGNHTARSAIDVHYWGDAAVDHVTIQNFTEAGIPVAGDAHLTVGPGTLVKACGSNAGMTVQGNAVVTIDNPAGDPIAFTDNESAGIAVSGNGALTIRGTPTKMPDQGTVMLLRNGAAGLWVGSSAVVDGVVSSGNETGFSAYAGAKLRLRNSWSLGNERYGVYVPSTCLPFGVDLGTATSPGRNVLQGTGASQNGGAGICFDGGDCAGGLTLPARGNVFGAIDCSGAGGTLTTAYLCELHSDVRSTSASNTIDVADCTLP